MVDIDIAKAHKEKTKALKFWSSQTFAELMEYSPLEAARYAVDCNIKTELFGVPAEQYIAEKEGTLKEGPQVDIEEIVEPLDDTDEVLEEEKEEITKDELKELLKANEIKFHHTAGLGKLMELAKINELL